MAFRKRHDPVVKPAQQSNDYQLSESGGLRQSPLDGRPTTSTGLHSVDGLFAGHAALPLGCSLLVEERGTSDFGGIMLRFYAAEGILQGHQVHVVGMPTSWAEDLPGVDNDHHVHTSPDSSNQGPSEDKMKIAWRYEISRGLETSSRAASTTNRSNNDLCRDKKEGREQREFCHSFDMTKRLSIDSGRPLHHIEISPTAFLDPSCLSQMMTSLAGKIASTSHDTIHRLIVPSFISPALYPPQSWKANHTLRFLGALRALLRIHSHQLTAMLTISTSLHHHHSGIVSWIEELCDGVMELLPFPYSIDIKPCPSKSLSPGRHPHTSELERPHGMFKVHKLPITTEKGGGCGMGEDLAFSVRRKDFVVSSYHLPPVGGSTEGHETAFRESSSQDKIEF